MTRKQLGLFDHLTHKANLKHTRFGWLRLTPAYSVHLVEDVLDNQPADDLVVLDPFCGTGTTALVCASKGIRSETIDINPFLVWLANTKTQSYSLQSLQEFKQASAYIVEMLRTDQSLEYWTPPIFQIEKWWEERTLVLLGHAMHLIHGASGKYSQEAVDLLKLVFCRVMITHSNASFNHQSMSFKSKQQGSIFENMVDNIVLSWLSAEQDIFRSAQESVRQRPKILLCDARKINLSLPSNYYTCVITSPPYPNRMSYIRELRPYMYWLGYLDSGRQAGELDWQAIGGTWGVATSNVGKWVPSSDRPVPYQSFYAILDRITERSDILARYVHKYFYDMVEHVENLFQVTKSGASINYIVGNSKFYDVLLPVEEIFASIFSESGYVDVRLHPIRKRTSKKELFEYIVTATRP